MKDILSEFHKELQLREQCVLNTKEVRTSGSNQRGESLSSTAALFSDSSKEKGIHVWCSFCNQDHESHQSSNYNFVTNPEDRKRVLKRKGNCFLSLKTGHLSRNCKGSMKCFIRHGLQHFAMCGCFNQTITSQSQTQNEKLPSVSTSMYVNQSKGSVLLQTATAQVIRPDNDNRLI